MLINQEFQSYLAKIDPQNNEGCVENHISLVFESSDSSQDFLQSLDDNFNTNTMASFDKPDWNIIGFKIPIGNLLLKFGGLEFKASLTGVKVTRVEKKSEFVTKYIVMLKLDQTMTVENMKTEIMLKEFLKRKEENTKTGKKEFVLYKTLISKLI